MLRKVAGYRKTCVNPDMESYPLANQPGSTSMDPGAHQQVHKTGQGKRIFVCPLLTKSLWLNPIEPKWMYGKRRIVEPDRTHSALEVEARVCVALGTLPEVYLSVSEKVA